MIPAIKYTALAVLFAVLAAPNVYANIDRSTESFSSKLRDIQDDGFEIGNGRTGSDVGGFEIGNGRTVMEYLNPNGPYSIKAYNDFDVEIKGKKLIASGNLAKGGKATITTNVDDSSEFATAESFIVNGIKNKLGSVFTVNGRKGLRKDSYDKESETYTMDVSLHVGEGQILFLNIESSLEGLKEINAITNSLKVQGQG